MQIVTACSNAPAVAGSAASAEPSASAPKITTEALGRPDELIPVKDRYPMGRWRLAPFRARDRTVLWFSHILIRHQQSDPEASILRSFGWSPEGAASTRTAAEAYQLAEAIAKEARHDAEQFPQLAIRYSEDVTTCHAGGSLGGVRAGQLPNELLDVLAVLPPGGVSNVVSSALGYHVLRRDHVPKREILAGRRILIGYSGTTPNPDRSRTDALTIALRIRDQLRSGVPVKDLARKWSDSCDAEDGGDFGVWSTTWPDYVGREVEALSRLRIGEISHPVETRHGFSVLVREDASSRSRAAEYAMSMVKIGFAADDPKARVAAKEVAETVAARIASGQSKFEDMQKQYCCQEPELWAYGGAPAIEKALDELDVGEISERPILANWEFVIPRRLDPSAVREELPSYELPAPERPDVELLVRNNNGIELARYVREIRDGVERDLEIGSIPKRSLTVALSRLAESFEAHSEVTDEHANARVASARAIEGEIARDLGLEYEKYRRYVDQFLTKLMVGRAL